MADPTLFTWSGTDYRSSESFGTFLHIKLPDGTLLECDAVTAGAPVNLQLAVTDDEGDRAVAFEVIP
jgi:hypothetical protein